MLCLHSEGAWPAVPGTGSAPEAKEFHLTYHKWSFGPPLIKHWLNYQRILTRIPWDRSPPPGSAAALQRTRPRSGAACAVCLPPSVVSWAWRVHSFLLFGSSTLNRFQECGICSIYAYVRAQGWFFFCVCRISGE